MGREGLRLRYPTWARGGSVQPGCGEAQAGPSPRGDLWVPGTGVGSLCSSRGCSGEGCLGCQPALHQHPKTAASGALWVWELLL